MWSEMSWNCPISSVKTSDTSPRLILCLVSYCGVDFVLWLLLSFSTFYFAPGLSNLTIRQILLMWKFPEKRDLSIIGFTKL